MQELTMILLREDELGSNQFDSVLGRFLPVNKFLQTSQIKFFFLHQPLHFNRTPTPPLFKPIVLRLDFCLPTSESTFQILRIAIINPFQLSNLAWFRRIEFGYLFARKVCQNWQSVGVQNQNSNACAL